MKAINKKATQIMMKLVDGLEQPGDHKKIGEGGSFMAVSVECIDITADNQKVFSVAHYYEQNGDLCTDPEMTFLEGPQMNMKTGKIEIGFYPLTFEMSGTGIYRNAVKWEDGKIAAYSPGMQKDHATFAGQWMSNIKQQQF